MDKHSWGGYVCDKPIYGSANLGDSDCQMGSVYSECVLARSPWTLVFKMGCFVLKSLTDLEAWTKLELIRLWRQKDVNCSKCVRLCFISAAANGIRGALSQPEYRAGSRITHKAHKNFVLTSHFHLMQLCMIRFYQRQLGCRHISRLAYNNCGNKCIFEERVQ